MGEEGGELLAAVAGDQVAGPALAIEHARLVRRGQDAAVLARAAGKNIPADVEMTFGETDESNPFVPVEQMMPFLPFVRARDIDHAIEMAVRSEHGFRHTAIIHSNDVVHMTKMGKAVDTTLFIKNGPSMAGLGVGGEGYTSFSIAGPTGEGATPGTKTDSPSRYLPSRRTIPVE